MASACRSGRGPAAVEACRTVLRRALTPILSSGVEATLSARLLDEGDPEGALAVLRTAALARPRDAAARARLGALAFHLQRYEEAEAEQTEARHLRPDDAASHVALAVTLNARGRHAESIAAFGEATRLDPRVLEERPAAARVLAASRAGRRWPQPEPVPED